jgi:lipopolysaccharide/colanic/teichoic acid biosynthesis glycosyltransferase
MLGDVPLIGLRERSRVGRIVKRWFDVAVSLLLVLVLLPIMPSLPPSSA